MKTINLSFAALDLAIGELIQHFVDPIQGSMWQCSVCQKQIKTKRKMEFHIETHLEGFYHNCLHCGRSFKTRDSLAVHVSRNHKSEKNDSLMIVDVNNMFSL